MTCPNCGFENLPGRTACGVCAASLAPAPERESVMPKRARERTLSESVRWRVEQATHRSVPTTEAVVGRLPPAVVIRQFVGRCLAVLVSVIPGVGYAWSGSWGMAGLSAFGALACVVEGGIWLQTRVADVALFAVASLSTASVIAAMDWGFPSSGGSESRQMRRIGRTLMMVCAFAVMMVMAFYAPLTGLSLTRAPLDVPSAGLQAGDRIINVAQTAYRRGDVVLCQGTNLATVDAVPGDWAANTTDEGVGAPIRLKPGEYGVRYIDRYNYHYYGAQDEGFRIRPAVIDRSAIRSRLTFIYNPPARRGWVRPVRTP